MLNPRAYLEDCIRASKMALWNTDFPWALIDHAINLKSLEYNPGEEAVRNFTEITGRPWDNLWEPKEKRLRCLRCSHHFNVLWTTAEIGSSADVAFESSRGYADRGFEAYCNCGFKHSHQVLRVARFNRDVEDLLAFNRPLPGTYLNLEGVPESLQELSFPNALMKAGHRSALNCLKPGGDVSDMNGVRELIESRINDVNIMQSVNGGTINGAMKVLFSKAQKISIRRMMSHYWENSSIFGLDLVGAVVRQGSFIRKMDNIDWLHSPALSTTVDRLIRKYMIFLEIMFKNRDNMAVPTLDVDLAWHTHQMTTFRYYVYTTSRTTPKTFINHDDKVAEGKLSDAFEWTTKEYKLITNGEPYSECTCWYCEATREPILYSSGMNMLSSSTRHSRTLAKDLHKDPRISSEPDKNAHISAHNAVQCRTDGAGRMADEMRMTRLQELWEKASRRAHKHHNKQKEVGSAGDKDGYCPMVWGYPYKQPQYVPFATDPSISIGPYPGNPGWLNTNIGGYGNCAQGTCSNMVAAGECASKNGGATCGSAFNNAGILVDDAGDGPGCTNCADRSHVEYIGVDLAIAGRRGRLFGGCGSSNCGGGCGGG